MKKMNNNYEAPVAEVIELNVNKDMMTMGGPTWGQTSTTPIVP
jgi:hypothetical protein